MCRSSQCRGPPPNHILCCYCPALIPCIPERLSIRTVCGLAIRDRRASSFGKCLAKSVCDSGSFQPLITVLTSLTSDHYEAIIPVAVCFMLCHIINSYYPHPAGAKSTTTVPTPSMRSAISMTVSFAVFSSLRYKREVYQGVRWAWRIEIGESVQYIT
jgi:hypothetical protein